MLDCEVTVINCSLGAVNSEKNYTAMDRLIDELIDTTGISFVVAAGNYDSEKENPEDTWNIYSPAMAYNAITVGAIQTYELDDGDTRFPTYSEGSYRQASYLTNKPDICAPGYMIRFLYAVDGVNHIVVGADGTSFAAPIVTGVVAQMQQAGANGFRMWPGLVKSVLVTAATNDLVSTDNRNTITYGLGKKSGAGLINAIDSVNIANSSKWDLSYFVSDMLISDTSVKYFSAGQTVRVSMVFEKSHSGLITNTNQDDLDLHLIDSNNQVLASTTALVNNVSVIEYTITQSGYYHFRINSLNVIGDRINYYYSWNLKT